MTNYFSIPSNIPLSPRQTNAGFIYGYDNLTRAKDVGGRWNPDNINRIDQYGNKVALSKEIDKAFAGLGLRYIPSLGYPPPPPIPPNPPIDGDTIIMLVSQTPFTDDQQATFNSVIAAHEANTVGDKYGIKKPDGTYAMDEAIPTQLDLFDTVEQAQQAIVLEQYIDAVVIPVMVF
jgi:hypothetical protein